MTRRIRRIVLTATVLPLVVLIGLRSAWASYACSITGEVMADCCCPKQSSDESAPTDGAPRIEASCCCDVTFAELSPQSDVRESDRSRGLDAPAITVEAPFVIATSPHNRVTSTHAALARPPPPDLPTYLANCSILR